ncbi:MAG TPA: peptidylprolyl isomerase [Methylophilaceae bacterium]|jgi:peptidyl-prolyl cis-trans isomerase A (cyclophilin A)
MWQRYLVFFLFLCACSTVLAANPQVEFQTSLGNFVVELYPDKAPHTVENFLQYVNVGFYTGTVFERAIPNFVAQGGELTDTLQLKSTYTPVASESTNGLLNDRGTIAMVHGHSADSATSRFFVNLADNHILNYVRHEEGFEGYTVFGRIIRGLDVLVKIGTSPTGDVGKLHNVPVDLPVIRAAYLLEHPIEAESLPPEVPQKNKTIVKKKTSSKLTKKGNASGKTAN